jgi:dihydroorotase
MDLNDALSRVTSIPAATIKMQDELGTLNVGAVADATVLRLCEGKREMEDTVGKVETIERWLEPVYVVKGGRVVARHV